MNNGSTPRLAFMATHKKDLAEARLAIEIAKEEAGHPQHGGHKSRGDFDVEQFEHSEHVDGVLARLGLGYRS